MTGDAFLIGYGVACLTTVWTVARRNISDGISTAGALALGVMAALMCPIFGGAAAIWWVWTHGGEKLAARVLGAPTTIDAADPLLGVADWYAQGGVTVEQLERVCDGRLGITPAPPLPAPLPINVMGRRL